MQRVPIELLQQDAARWVRLAAAGETVLVTDAGEVVAELRPRGEAGWQDLPPAMADLVTRGLVVPPERPGAAPPAGLRLVPHDQLMQDLATDREDRR